jgi:hypothetical protein
MHLETISAQVTLLSTTVITLSRFSDGRKQLTVTQRGSLKTHGAIPGVKMVLAKFCQTENQCLITMRLVLPYTQHLSLITSRINSKSNMNNK